MKKLVVVGGGGHCKSVLDALLDGGSNEYEHIVITDCQENVGKRIQGVEIIGTDEQLEDLYIDGYQYAFIAVGNIKSTMLRRKLCERVLEIGYKLINIIDRTAILASDVKLGAGVFVGKAAIINTGSKIGNMAIINTGAIIEHECEVQEYCHVSVGSVLCGNVRVEHDSFIGANSVVIQNRTIGANSVIGAGSIVKEGKT